MTFLNLAFSHRTIFLSKFFRQTYSFSRCYWEKNFYIKKCLNLYLFNLSNYSASVYLIDHQKYLFFIAFSTLPFDIVWWKIFILRRIFFPFIHSLIGLIRDICSLYGFLYYPLLHFLMSKCVNVFTTNGHLFISNKSFRFTLKKRSGSPFNQTTFSVYEVFIVDPWTQPRAKRFHFPCCQVYWCTKYNTKCLKWPQTKGCIAVGILVNKIFS